MILSGKLGKMKPTEEKIKRFWEWCGFTVTSKGVIYGDAIMVDDSCHHIMELPEIDLNNLFKYAVPKLHAYVLQSFHKNHSYHHASVVLNEYTGLEDVIVSSTDVPRDEDPALALFWAIYKAGLEE